MGVFLKRVVLIVGGLFLLTANNFIDDTEGTFLGFYPPDSAGRLGYDASKLAIMLLALWGIARGFGLRFRKKPAAQSIPPTTV